MKFAKFNAGLAIVAAAGLVSTTQDAQASSHREAPMIAEDPAADNTDVYAWMSPNRDKLYIVANYIPLEEPAGGPNFHKFSDDVRYEIHITRGANSLEDYATYFIDFNTSAIQRVDPADLNAPLGGGKEFFSQLSGQTQTYRVIKRGGNGRANVIGRDFPVAPTNIGPRTFAVIRSGETTSPEYDDAYAAQFINTLQFGEGRIWAGPRDDGFYVDLGGVFDLANLRPAGVAQDGVSGYNVHSIAMEIDVDEFNGGPVAAGPSNENTLGIWAAASRRKISIRRNRRGKTVNFGPWVRVSRLAIPLVNEALIGLQDKDKYNRTHPRRDVQNFGAYFLNPVVVRDAEAVGIYAALGVDPTPFKSNRTDIIDIINLTNIPSPNAHSIPLEKTGDVLRVDMGVESGFPNGRPIPGGAFPDQEQADVTDVLLSVILAGGQLPISDGVDYNDKEFLADFPFLPLPHRGFDEGHGIPTP
ncbi:MAG: DUF4331 domain-containing protein [Deltaproteobacteria bacterium]